MHKLFETQREGENILYLSREHPIRLLAKIAIWLIMTIPLILTFFFASQIRNSLGGDLTLYFVAACVYSMFLVDFLLLLVSIYYLNVYIVTDQRVVDVDQTNILARSVSELRLDSIEDVTSETNGLIATMLGYGNVYIQTAGSVNRFEFLAVSDPTHVAELILTAQKHFHETSSND